MMGDAAEARFEADLAKAIALSLQAEAKDNERRRTSGSVQINLPPGKSYYSGAFIVYCVHFVGWVMQCFISVVCQLLDTLSLGLVSGVSIVVTRVMSIIQEVSYYDTSRGVLRAVCTLLYRKRTFCTYRKIISVSLIGGTK